MKLESLGLANFRGFHQLDLEFEPDVNVLVGVNGVGKTSILYALAALFSRALPEFTPAPVPTPARALRISNDDINHERSLVEVSLVLTLGARRFHATFQRSRADAETRATILRRLAEVRKAQRPEMDARTVRRYNAEERRLMRVLENGTELFSFLTEDIRVEPRRTGELDAPQQATRKILHSYRQEPNQPLVVLFSTNRRLQGRPRSRPELKPFEVAAAYRAALDDREVDLREFMHWFRVVETGIGGASGERILHGLRRVVESFLPGFENLRLAQEPRLRFIVEKNAVPLALDQLSDGERGLLALIFDLTRRLHLANPELEDPVADGQAIVLIDEIELHLHPRWQRDVLARLHEIFQNTQFIVTTHSPQVIGEAEGRCVRILICEDGRVKSWTPPHARGLDSRRVLEELMDASSRNQQVDATLGRLFRLIDDEEFTAARQLIEELQGLLGEDEPELTRAHALMAFLEAPDEDDPQELTTSLTNETP